MTATVSTHTLNGVDGIDAAGIAVMLTRIGDGLMTPLFVSCTDECGRLCEDIDLGSADPMSTYEMIFATGPYWAARETLSNPSRIVHEVSLRFRMLDPHGKYHMPVILSPNSYSTWFSS